MKPKLTILPISLFLLFIFNGDNASGQFITTPLLRAVFLNQNVYKTIDELQVQKVYNSNTKVVINDKTKYKIKPAAGSFIRYSVVNDDESIIRILPLVKFVDLGSDKNIEFRAKSAIAPTDDPSDYYFKIVDELTTPAKKYLATEHLTAIPVTIPIKYRFKAYVTDTKFTFDANIAYGFGYKIRVNNANVYKEQYVRPLFVMGVGLQEYMPSDSVKSDTFKPDNELTFTYSVGMTYEGGSNLNLGLFLGWDRMFGDKKDWYYQNKPWLGIGVGFKFD